MAATQAGANPTLQANTAFARATRMGSQQASLSRLLEKARSGDRAAFAALLTPRRQKLLNISIRMVGCREDALDIVQEACITFFKHLGRLDPRRNFDGWLVQVTVRLCYKHLRKRADRSASLHREDLDLPDPERSQELLLSDHETAGAIEECLAELAPQERAAFVLRDLEGMRGAEVAEAMGCKSATARFHYFQARKKLRRTLLARFPDLCRRDR